MTLLEEASVTITPYDDVDMFDNADLTQVISDVNSENQQKSGAVSARELADTSKKLNFQTRLIQSNPISCMNQKQPQRLIVN